MIYFLVLRNSWREFGTEKVSEPVSERIWYRKVPKLVSEKIWYQNSPGTGLGENLVLKKSWNWSWRKLGTEKSPRTGLGENVVPKKSWNRCRREFGTKNVPELVWEKILYQKSQIFGSRHKLHYATIL